MTVTAKLGERPNSSAVWPAFRLGNLDAANDFGVLMLFSGTTSWVLAAPGMPNVEVAGLTFVPSDRILYAATHGLGAWRLNLD